MKSFILKNRKKIMIFSPFFVIFFLAFSLYNFLGPTVGIILSVVLKPKFSIGKIELPENISKEGKITAKNVILSYQKQKIVEAPELFLLYNFNNPLNRWIEKIVVNSPKVLIERKNSDINIVEAFSTGSKSENKAGTGVPLGKIEVKDADLIYRDISYKFPIEKNLNSTEGYVTFHPVKGIDLKFQGKDKNTELSYSFNNEVEDYSMNISGRKIPLNTTILQYAYYYEDIEYEEGVGDLDLTISPKGLFGYADIKNLTVNYKPFLENAKNIEGKVEFNGELIDIQADFDLFEKNRYFSLNFDFNNELNIDIDLGDLTYEEVSKYYLLNDLNLHIANLNFKNSNINLNLDKERKFIAKLNLEIDDIEEKNYGYKDGKISIFADENKTEIKLSKSKLIVLDFNYDISTDLIIKDKNMEIFYSIDNFLGKGNLEFTPEKLKIKLQEGILKLEGEYDYQSKELFLNEEKSSLKEDKFNLVYNFNKKILKYFQGKIKLNILDEYFIALEGNGEENLLNIETFLINDKEEKLIFISEGSLNLENMFYNFRFKTEEFKFDRQIGTNKIKTLSFFTGELKKGETGVILDLDGTLEKLDVNDFMMHGIKISVRLKENVLEILDISNNFLTFKGDYNIIENSLEGNFEINDFKREIFEIGSLDFNLVQVKGKISGLLDNPRIDTIINKGEIYFPNQETLDFKGEIILEEKKLKLHNFTINSENKIEGEYDLKDKNFQMSGTISEKNVFRYLNIKTLKGNVQGEFYLKGNENSLSMDSNLELKKLYFKGNELPEIRSNFNYTGDIFLGGIITFKNVNLIREDYEFAKLIGTIDLYSKKLDLKLIENSFRLGKAFPEYKVKGPIELDFQLTGELNSPNYNFTLKSEALNYEEIKFENFILKGNGNSKKIYLEDLEFLYQNNRFQALGEYDILAKDYNFKLKSQDIQLDFLNPFLEKYNTSLKGRAYFDLSLNSKGDTGVFAGENIGFNFTKLGVQGEKIDFEFELLKKKLEIVNFKGKINEGETKLSGFLQIPTLEERENNPYFYQKLNYDLTFQVEGFKYIVPNYMDFLINSNLNLNSNKIKGDLEIEKGNLIKIPGVGEGINILKILKDFFFEKVANKKIKKDILWDEELSGDLESKIELDLDVRINEGIRIDVDSIAGIVQNLVGNFKGGGKFSGTGKKINFLGEFNLNNGEFVLTDNEFQINSARVIFNNPKDLFPEINPLVTFEADSRSFTDNISLSLNGELNALQFAIKSNGSVSSGNLSSLFNNTSQDTNNKNAISSLLLKSAIDSQITQTFLGPFSRELKKFFGLSKLRISSDFSSGFFQDNSSTEQNLEKTNQEYSFGAKVEIADSLYKERLFWIASAKITNNTSTEEKTSEGSFNEYKAGLLYKFSQSNSLEIGVQSFGKDTVGIKNKETDKKSLNYYIDFKIQKKYDSLSEIFKYIVDKVKK